MNKQHALSKNERPNQKEASSDKESNKANNTPENQWRHGTSILFTPNQHLLLVGEGQWVGQLPSATPAQYCHWHNYYGNGLSRRGEVCSIEALAGSGLYGPA